MKAREQGTSVCPGCTSALTVLGRPLADLSWWRATAAMDRRAGWDQQMEPRDVTIYRMRSDPGLPCCGISSLYEDDREPLWVAGYRGLAVFEKGRFSAVPSLPAGSYFGILAIAGDNHGGLWLSLWFTHMMTVWRIWSTAKS